MGKIEEKYSEGILEYPLKSQKIFPLFIKSGNDDRQPLPFRGLLTIPFTTTIAETVARR